jgi:signal peptidase I
MDFDFALLLVVLTAVTGVIWLLDRLFLYRGRQARANAPGSGPRYGSRTPAGARPRRCARPIIVEYARSFFPVILIVLLFRSFIAEPFKIPSGSMMPTLLVVRLHPRQQVRLRHAPAGPEYKILEVGEPQRGDVFVFRYPRNPKVDYIKRVIGLPGDEITYRNKIVYVNGKEVPQTYLGTVCRQRRRGPQDGRRRGPA